MVDAATLDLNLRAADLYRQGYTLREIASYQERGYKAVNNALHRLGVTARRVGQRNGAAVAGLRPLVPSARPHCIRCLILLGPEETGDLCADCDAELRAGRLYQCEELPAETRRAMGY